MSYLISIDCGMAQTKYAFVHPLTGAIKVNAFQTVIADHDPNTLEKAECVVTFGQRTLTVGGQEFYTELPESTSKLTDKHRICIYTAIAKSLVALNTNVAQTLSVHLCLNVPLEEYKNVETRQSYQNNYEGQTIELVMNGIQIRFVIDQLTLNYEGQGAIFHLAQQSEELQNGLVCLTDIGGYNDSCICFLNLRPITGQNRAMMNGVLKMFYNVACELSQNPVNGQLTRTDVEYMSKGIHHFKAEGFDEIYHKHADLLVKRIYSNITSLTPTPAQTTFVFSGGGSQALASELQQTFSRFKTITLNDSQYDNCIGMLEYALYNTEKGR